MEPTHVLEYDWPYLLSFLPPEEELLRTARIHKAFTRKRNISSASDLLRLAFAYSFCGLSFRQSAAWANVAGVAILSDVALLNRLRSSSSWLGYLLATKLAESAPPPNLSARPVRIRLVDATCISRPGSRGTDWRVHLGFDLVSLAIDHIDITDHTGGETLKRFVFQPGELVLADRGYAHRPGLAAVIRSKADFLVRLNWQTVPLQHRSGEPFDLLNTLRGLTDLHPGDFSVMVAPSKQDATPAIPARLLAIRKSEAAAAAARAKVLQERSRQGRNVDPRTLEAAGYVFLITSVPVERLSAQEGLDLYRFRWQIELAFKRLKSLLELDVLPAKDPVLARSILSAKLLAALLLENLTESFLNFSPWGYRLAPATSIAVEDPTRAV